MPSKIFNKSEDAIAYAKKHTRCRIKAGKTVQKLTEAEKKVGKTPKVETHWRVITYNRNKEVN